MTEDELLKATMVAGGVGETEAKQFIAPKPTKK
jgi:hypothetical protein